MLLYLGSRVGGDPQVGLAGGQLTCLVPLGEILLDLTLRKLGEDTALATGLPLDGSGDGILLRQLRIQHIGTRTPSAKDVAFAHRPCRDATGKSNSRTPFPIAKQEEIWKDIVGTALRDAT